MVHEQRLQLRNIFKQRLLHASTRQLRRDMRYGVSQKTPEHYIFKSGYQSNIHNSAFFSFLVIYSTLSIIPTQQERSSRADNIEMAKLSEYRPDTMTRDEQRDMNRQIFLNLPKTPTTPWGRDPNNPMTPRTVAFTQLNGGGAAGPSSHQSTQAAQGPSRLLPFRQQYGDGVDGS